jgi:hypothetical protein
MAGGLLNLVAYGNQNIILNGNPSKTFFKCTYAKYTNFGLQKFRIDYDGLRTLRMTEPSVFQFKMPRYGDLLMDTYLVVKLPTIWSPIVPKCDTDGNAKWWPYEFKWIDNLGAQMIKRVRFSVGGQVIQEFTGQYLYNLVERDFDAVKKKLFYEMTGNVAELNDPANAFGRVNTYPSVYPWSSTQQGVEEYLRYGPEPSIRARELYIPLNIWFTLAAKMAFPLVSLQYQELTIDVEIRPVNELFVVRYVGNEEEGGSEAYHQPNFNDPWYQFYRFLQPPPYQGSQQDLALDKSEYLDTRTDWDADIHLVSTYGFLSDEEVRVFASRPQQYLIREVYQYQFDNVTGSSRAELRSSLGMVTNWMWYFQRSDAYLRNQWSNYTNWAYNGSIPYQVVDPDPLHPSTSSIPKYQFPCPPSAPQDLTPYNNYDKTTGATKSGIFITGKYEPANVKPIMETWALLFDGKYRENTLQAGVLSYVEKYTRTSGCAPEGLYCYNFCLHTDPFDFQPSGAINLSKFNKIEFEFTTYQPPLDPSAQSYVICGQEDGVTTTVGINKPTWRIYDYNFDLTVMEERYNVLTFASGNAGLMYAR